jgi:hypothetical protein
MPADSRHVVSNDTAEMQMCGSVNREAKASLNPLPLPLDTAARWQELATLAAIHTGDSGSITPSPASAAGLALTALGASLQFRTHPLLQLA